MGTSDSTTTMRGSNHRADVTEGLNMGTHTFKSPSGTVKKIKIDVKPEEYEAVTGWTLVDAPVKDKPKPSDTTTGSR